MNRWVKNNKLIQGKVNRALPVTCNINRNKIGQCHVKGLYNNSSFHEHQKGHKRRLELEYDIGQVMMDLKSLIA